MAEPVVRTIAAQERDAVLDLLAGWFGDAPGTPGQTTARAFFARYLVHDPSYRDDLCFVAEVDGRLVSTLQVFRKHVRTAAAVLAVGAVGNVYTAPAWRARGLAAALLDEAVGALEAHGFDASLLFAEKLAFYGRHGWESTPRHLAFLPAGGPAAPPPAGTRPFDAARDLAEVMRIYDAYSGSVPGATVRDAAYWHGQLRYAGNPGERFLVVRRGAEMVAYARAADLYDLNVVIEHGCLPGETETLAALLVHQHGCGRPRPGTLAQLLPDAALIEALAERAVEAHGIADPTAMWRPADSSRLAAAVRRPAAAVRAPGFLATLFPLETSRYWIADRF